MAPELNVMADFVVGSDEDAVQRLRTMAEAVSALDAALRESREFQATPLDGVLPVASETL